MYPLILIEESVWIFSIPLPFKPFLFPQVHVPISILPQNIRLDIPISSASVIVTVCSCSGNDIQVFSLALLDPPLCFSVATELTVTTI